MNFLSLSDKEIVRVLLVDDDPDFAEAIKIMLNSVSEIIIDHVTTLDKALQVTGSRYDVVLLDLDLPGSTIDDTYVKFCEKEKHVPVVILTSHVDSETMIHALEVGVEEYLLKSDLSKNRILQEIEKAIIRKEREVRISRLSKEEIEILHSFGDQVMQVWSIVISSISEIMVKASDKPDNQILVRDLAQLMESVSKSLSQLHRALNPSEDNEDRLNSLVTLIDNFRENDE